jgi:hypothetical protein
MILWGIERFLDEHLWLGEDGHLGSLLVQWAGVGLAVVGVVLLATRVGPLQRWRRGEGGDPAPDPAGSSRSPHSAGDASAGDASAGDASAGDASAGDASAGDASAGDASAGESSVGDAVAPSVDAGPVPAPIPSPVPSVPSVGVPDGD